MPALVPILLLLCLAPALAQENLYGPQAPRDAAFVRFVNAAAGEAAAPALDGEAWEPVEFAAGTPYRQVAPGEHAFEVAGARVPLTLGPESFTTVVLLEGGPHVFEDVALRDISRGLLTFYNLSAGETLALRTADGSEVFSQVAPLSAESLAISEAEVGLAVYSGEEQLAALEPRLYARGEAHSVIFLPPGSEPQVLYLPAAAEF